MTDWMMCSLRSGGGISDKGAVKSVQRGNVSNLLVESSGGVVKKTIPISTVDASKSVLLCWGIGENINTYGMTGSGIVVSLSDDGITFSVESTSGKITRLAYDALIWQIVEFY